MKLSGNTIFRCWRLLKTADRTVWGMRSHSPSTWFDY